MCSAQSPYTYRKLRSRCENCESLLLLKLLVSACMQCFRSEKSESIPPYFVQVCHKCNKLRREVMLYPLFHASTSSSVAFTVYSSRIYTLIRSVFINSQHHILHQIVQNKTTLAGPLFLSFLRPWHTSILRHCMARFQYYFVIMKMWYQPSFTK